MRCSNKKFILIGGLVVPFILIYAVLFYIYFLSARPYKNLAEQKPEIQKVKHYAFGDILLKGAPLIEDFDITEYSGGQKIFTVTGKKMRVKSRKAGTMRIAFGKVAEIDSAAVVFYKNNKAASTLISPRASIDLTDKQMTFYDKADVMTKDKRLLTSDKVTWNNDEKRILARGNCVLDTVDGKRITGDSIDTDVELRYYNVIITGKSRNPINNIIKLTGIER
jgi:hypothetical protein